MTDPKFIDYRGENPDSEVLIKRSRSFYSMMNRRRSIRHFSDREVPREVIEHIIKSAGTAPSGAHKQPWTFCVVTNPAIRTKIRERAEEEERISYGGRMSDQWLKDLEPLGTDHHKPFIEEAACLIVVFKRPYEITPEGNKQQNYYVNESVGIAVGMLLTAIHQAGLSALTHTPSPMNFLSEVLNRPENERAFMLIPVGYAHANAQVPNLTRKPLKEICAYYD